MKAQWKKKGKPEKKTTEIFGAEDKAAEMAEGVWQLF